MKQHGSKKNLLINEKDSDSDDIHLYEHPSALLKVQTKNFERGFYGDDLSSNYTPGGSTVDGRVSQRIQYTKDNNLLQIDTSSVFLPQEKNRHKQNFDHEFWNDPEPEDLCDLFNFAFTKKNSCFKSDSHISQSMYLFLHKFKGNKGLIKFLKSSFDGVRLLTFRNDSIHFREMKKVSFNDDIRGILGDETDIKWRQEKYGVNHYPQR